MNINEEVNSYLFIPDFSLDYDSDETFGPSQTIPPSRLRTQPPGSNLQKSGQSTPAQLMLSQRPAHPSQGSTRPSQGQASQPGLIPLPRTVTIH